MSSTSSWSSSIIIPANDKRELHRFSGWKRHAAWVILGLAFLLGSGAGGSVAILHSSRGQPIFSPHITLRAIGRSASRITGSPALADRSWRNWSSTDGDIGGGPPLP
jgi:hypothetical protein